MVTRKPPPAPPDATSASSGNVYQLHKAAPAIEPEEGWVSTWNGRALRFKAGPSGRLVRLAEVVKWLMRSPHELPLAEAVRQVVSKVEQAGSGFVVCRLDDVDFARPETSEWDAAYRYFDDYEYMKKFTPAVAAVNGLQSWLMNPLELSRMVNAPGFPTDYDPRTETPFEYSERTQDRESLLAVDFETANRLWGWGRQTEPTVTNDAATAPVDPANDEWWRAWCNQRNSANKNADGTEKKGRARLAWDDDSLQIMWQRFDVLKARLGDDGKAITSLAADLGMTPQAVQKHLVKRPDLQSEASNQPGQKVN